MANGFVICASLVVASTIVLLTLLGLAKNSHALYLTSTKMNAD